MCYFSRGKEEIILEIFHFSAFERQFDPFTLLASVARECA